MGIIVRSLSLAAMLCVASSALADCPAANKYSFSFDSLALQTLTYGTTYTYTATSTALGSQNFTLLMSQNGMTSFVAGSETRPNISASHNGGGTTKSLVLGGIFGGRTASITGTTNRAVTTFSFPTPVRDASFSMHDIDFTSNQFRDWVRIVGINASNNYVPAIVTPWGQANSTGPFTNASSSLKLGPQATAPAAAVAEAVGTGASGNNSTTGTISVSFAQPVTSIEVRYGNYPYQTGENTTGQQAVAIDGMTWCPMPTVTMTKTSAPWSDPQNGTTNPKLIPGADAIYTLTVTNSNASNISTSDLPAITDVLPAGVTFYNGDIDDGGPLTSNFEFIPGSSGLTLSSSGVTYSNNGGSTYAYTPAAGYDTNVQAVKFAPTGTSFAANSSFSIRFRVRIK